MKQKTEIQLYWLGLLLLFLIIGMTAVKRIAFPDFDIRSVMKPCVFYRLTGYFCPGCGGTRSVIALLHGKIIVSAVDFPMVVYCAAVYLWFLVSHTIEILSRGRFPIGMHYHVGWIYGTLPIVAVHCIVKNLFYIKTGIPPFL